MKSDDLSDILARTLGKDSNVDFHVGTILSWDDSNGSNRVRVRGAVLNNIDVLASAGISSLEPGTLVLIGKYRTQWFLVGRVVTQASGLAAPQFPVVLYPQFATKVTAGSGGYAVVTSGVLVSWEGRVRIVHPMIEVDGIWGNSSGTGSTTYELKLGGTTYGTWTSTTLEVARKGPFDVSNRMGQDWLKIELVITASTGTGDKAVQPLGVYFRQRPPVQT